MTLAALLAALLCAPSTAHAAPDPTGEFYARMLAEHDGVFVEEELAGVLDREESADDLRALLDEYLVDVDVVVIAGRGEYFAARDLAAVIHAHNDRPLLVLSVDSLNIGYAGLGNAGIPVSAVNYAGLTGGWYEHPEDKLERVLRMSDHPDVDELAEQAWAEVRARTDVEDPEPERDPEAPAFAALAWREHGWVSWAGGALGALLAYTGVIAFLRWYRHVRPAREEERR